MDYEMKRSIKFIFSEAELKSLIEAYDTLGSIQCAFDEQDMFTIGSRERQLVIKQSDISHAMELLRHICENDEKILEVN